MDSSYVHGKSGETFIRFTAVKEDLKKVRSRETSQSGFYLEVNVKGGIEAGGKVKLLAAEDELDLEAKIYGESGIVGKLIYKITEDKFEGKVYIEPLKVGIKVKIATKGTIKLTLVDVDASVTITDKFPIYGE